MRKYARWIVAGAVALAMPFVAEKEGSEPIVYLDTGKVPTVCIGHTGPEVVLGERWTDMACEAAFSSDVQEAALHVANLVTVPLEQYEFAAYISFVFNVGPTQFRHSTMLKLLNAGQYEAACNQFPRWKYDNGVVLRGLVKRRADERALCLGEFHADMDR